MYVRMKRTIIEQLKAWKESLYRKPLILSGARQVGKTYILQEFGKQEYDHVVYIKYVDNLRGSITVDVDTVVISSRSLGNRNMTTLSTSTVMETLRLPTYLQKIMI